MPVGDPGRREHARFAERPEPWLTGLDVQPLEVGATVPRRSRHRRRWRATRRPGPRACGATSRRRSWHQGPGRSARRSCLRRPRLRGRPAKVITHEPSWLKRQACSPVRGGKRIQEAVTRSEVDETVGDRWRGLGPLPLGNHLLPSVVEVPLQLTTRQLESVEIPVEAAHVRYSAGHGGGRAHATLRLELPSGRAILQLHGIDVAVAAAEEDRFPGDHGRGLVVVPDPRVSLRRLVVQKVTGLELPLDLTVREPNRPQVAVSPNDVDPASDNRRRRREVPSGSELPPQLPRLGIEGVEVPILAPRSKRRLPPRPATSAPSHPCETATSAAAAWEAPRRRLRCVGHRDGT